MDPVIKGYLQLTRPANLPTAVADILAGVAIAGISMDTYFMTTNGIRLFPGIVFLIFSSVCLYASGVVLNDVFDRKIDAVERPERPIPSGLIPAKHAGIFGLLLMITGIAFAFLTNTLSGLVSILLALSILSYDAYFKRFSIPGPLNMGLCRALNLILGMSLAGTLDHPEYALIHLIYIFAITLISRGEVHANNKNHIIWAGILYVGVIFAVVKIIPDKPGNPEGYLPFLILFIFLIFKPLIKAFRFNSAENVKKAVIAGVLSIIALDAVLASGFTNWWLGILVILLLPLSKVLSGLFQVT